MDLFDIQDWPQDRPGFDAPARTIRLLASDFVEELEPDEADCN